MKIGLDIMGGDYAPEATVRSDSQLSIFIPGSKISFDRRSGNAGQAEEVIRKRNRTREYRTRSTLERVKEYTINLNT